MTAPMEYGALARVVTEADDLATGRPGRRTYPPGFEFVVEDFVPAEESEDKRPFYWGSAHGGFSNVAVYAEHVEQAKSAEEMRARTLPTPRELLEALGSDLLVDGDDLTIHEVDKPEGSATEIYGRAANGLTFGARLRVEAIWHTDE